MSSYDEPPAPPAADLPPAPRPIPPMKPGTVDIPTGHSPFPLVLAAAFAAALVGSWIVEKSTASTPTPAAPAPAPTPAAEAPTPAADPTPTPSAVTAEDLKGIKDQVEALAKKVEAEPKADPSADIKPIQEKVDGLAKSVEATADLPKKLDEVAAKLADRDKEIASLKDEVASLKEAASKPKADAPAPAPAATPAAAPEPAKPAGVDMAAMTSAVDQFKAGKYAAALAAFKKLPADDARVLYFAALSSGFSSGNWTAGETLDLVTKGIDREKAGSPAKPEIDSAFSGLTTAQGKAWIDGYRSKAK